MKGVNANKLKEIWNMERKMDSNDTVGEFIIKLSVTGGAGAVVIVVWFLLLKFIIWLF